jgi:uncharacterized lipoprotein NlpE involved in copper resistance
MAHKDGRHALFLWHRMKTLLPLSLLLFIAACGTPDTKQAPAPVRDSLVEPSPTAWVGFYRDTVPCADCPGIVERLHLKADSTYVLTDLYMERDSIPFGQIGRWTVERGILTLRTDGVARRWKQDGQRLAPLDQEGKPIESPFSYSIERVDSFPIGLMHLTGGYVYYADSHSFTPDGSGVPYPVAMDEAGKAGAGLELERSYSANVKDPPTPLRVRITATLRTGPAMEGDGTEQYIHVERLDGEVGK